MGKQIRVFLVLLFALIVVITKSSVTLATDMETMIRSGTYDSLLTDLEAQYEAGELDDPESLWALSSLYFLAGDSQRSFRAAELAFEMEDPKDGLTYRRMGVLTFQLGRYRDAVEYLRTAAQMDKYDHWARYHLVLALDYLINRQGEFRLLDEYETYIVELLELERIGIKLPSLAYYYIGRHFAEKGRVVEAKYYYGEFVKLHDSLNQEDARYMINAINYLKAYD